MISIIIPVYNHAKELSKCLDSVLRQSYREFEAVVVNDGSTDNIQTVLDKYALIFANEGLDFKAIHGANKGAGAARNKGFLESKGDYVIFLDADIVMKPRMLQKMAEVLNKKEKYSYVYSSFRFGFKKFKLWRFSAKKLREMPYIHTSSLIRRDHFPGFDEELKKFQDWDLWLAMLEKGYRGKWIPRVLFKVKGGGTMSSWLPGIFYKVPWKKIGIKLQNIEKYNNSLEIIKNKHKL